VARLLLSGDGGVETLATNQAQPRATAIDGTYLYWLDNSGTLTRALLDGGSPAILVNDLGTVEFVAIDATSVYWTQDNGAVMKLTPR
jgi:hypothetical protein